MAQLRREYDRFEQLDSKLIVIGPDDANAFREYWQKQDLPFTGIPDPDGSVLRKYGQEVNLFKLGRMPAQVIVDRAGTIRYAHYGQSMADIPKNEELFHLLDELNQELSEVN